MYRHHWDISRQRVIINVVVIMTTIMSSNISELYIIYIFILKFKIQNNLFFIGSFTWSDDM